jgi:hypothetical protein
MPSICSILKDILVADALAGYEDPTADWQIFEGVEPPEPAKTITLLLAGGESPNPKWLMDYPSVQVRVRGAIGGYDDALDEAYKVRNSLLGLDNYLHTSGDRIDAINIMGDVFPMPADETGKPVFVINFKLRVEPSSTTTPTNRLPL